jgi:hypothetical protein
MALPANVGAPQLGQKLESSKTGFPHLEQNAIGTPPFLRNYGQMRR